MLGAVVEAANAENGSYRGWPVGLDILDVNWGIAGHVKAVFAATGPEVHHLVGHVAHRRREMDVRKWSEELRVLY